MKDILRWLIRLLLRVMYIFPVNMKKVYLTNFKGDQYGLDAKAFAEYLKLHYPNEYLIIWEIDDIKKAFDVEHVHCISKMSPKGFYHYMTAGIILTNMTPRSYIPFRKKQYIINTWHGYPMKKVGKYASGYNKYAYAVADCFSSYAKDFTDSVLIDSFEYTGNIINCGAPRNDIFFNPNSVDMIRDLKQSLGITANVVLYAPTFRGDYQYAESGIDVTRLVKALEQKSGEPWVILFRLHPKIADKIQDLPENTIDVSNYHDMQELLLISDILITDYSSCAWDFVQMKKPVFLFATDLTEFEADRGLYFPLQQLPYPLTHNNDELVEAIRTFDEEKYKENVCAYFERVGNYESGNACQTLLACAKQHHEKYSVKK